MYKCFADNQAKFGFEALKVHPNAYLMFFFRKLLVICFLAIIFALNYYFIIYFFIIWPIVDSADGMNLGIDNVVVLVFSWF